MGDQEVRVLGLGWFSSAKLNIPSSKPYWCAFASGLFRVLVDICVCCFFSHGGPGHLHIQDLRLKQPLSFTTVARFPKQCWDGGLL